MKNYCLIFAVCAFCLSCKRELNREESAYTQAFQEAVQQISDADQNFDDLISKFRQSYAGNRYLISSTTPLGEVEESLELSQKSWEKTRIPPRGFESSHSAMDSAYSRLLKGLYLAADHAIYETMPGRGSESTEAAIAKYQSQSEYDRKTSREFLESARNRLQEAKEKITGRKD